MRKASWTMSHQKEEVEEGSRIHLGKAISW